MVDKALIERLQPSLLDRLTDLQPSDRTEARDARVIDIRRLREIVQRDLSHLLNTTNAHRDIDADLFPHAAQSTLNYGVREVAGDYTTAERAEVIRRSILEAIERYEPRIRSGSARVNFYSADLTRTTILSFDIHAEMWAEPVPLELYLRSEVDVSTGDITLERKG